MIVSIAIVVLPVGAVADDQLPLAAADRGHRVDRLDAGGQRLVHRLALHHRRRLELQRATLRRLDLAEAVDRRAERVDDAAEVGVADGHREDLAGPLDRLALLDLLEVTQDHDADLAGVEVQGDAEGAVLELEQLVGHHRGQAADPRDAVAGLGDGADLFPAGRLGLVVRHEALQRVPDLLRTDRKLRHLLFLTVRLLEVRGALVSSGVGWRQPASLRRASSRRLATVPSITSSPISTRMPPITSGSTTTLRWMSRSYLRAQRVGQPLPLVARPAAGPPARSRPSAGARPRPPAGTGRAATRHGAVATGQRLLGQRHRGRQRLAVEQRAQQRALVLEPTGPGPTARRAGRVCRARPRRRRRARRRGGPIGSSAERTTATTPRCSSTSARSRVAVQRGATALPRGPASASPTLPPKISRARACLASAATDTSVATRRRAGSLRSTAGDREQVVAQPAASAPPASAAVELARPAPRGPRRRHRGRSSVDTALVGLDARPGTARPPGSAGPRRRGSHRRSDRPGPVASAPTSARSEVTACCRSASIWVLPCSTMRVDSACA